MDAWTTHAETTRSGDCLATPLPVRSSPSPSKSQHHHRLQFGSPDSCLSACFPGGWSWMGRFVRQPDLDTPAVE
eukprot:11992480-Alexandrium_andersonii.AAC.1